MEGVIYMSRKSFQLYFNMNNEDERMMYEYLENKNRNAEIKRILLNEIKLQRALLDELNKLNFNNKNKNDDFEDFDDSLWNE